MLFTPKKYGRDYIFGLAIGAYAMSLGFGICAVGFSFSRFDDLSGKIFRVVGFFAAMLILAAVEKSYWKTASQMSADDLGDRRSSAALMAGMGQKLPLASSRPTLATTSCESPSPPL